MRGRRERVFSGDSTQIEWLKTAKRGSGLLERAREVLPLEIALRRQLFLFFPLSLCSNGSSARLHASSFGAEPTQRKPPPSPASADLPHLQLAPRSTSPTTRATPPLSPPPSSQPSSSTPPLPPSSPSRASSSKNDAPPPIQRASWEEIDQSVWDFPVMRAAGGLRA